jgi:hypothetical protein
MNLISLLSVEARLAPGSPSMRRREVLSFCLHFVQFNGLNISFEYFYLNIFFLKGLKVALVEREDFASGTSSRSTKLIHGGVRYLEKAFWNLDYGQFKLVQEALI